MGAPARLATLALCAAAVAVPVGVLTAFLLVLWNAAWALGHADGFSGGYRDGYAAGLHRGRSDCRGESEMRSGTLLAAGGAGLILLSLPSLFDSKGRGPERAPGSSPHYTVDPRFAPILPENLVCDDPDERDVEVLRECLRGAMAPAG